MPFRQIYRQSAIAWIGFFTFFISIEANGDLTSILGMIPFVPSSCTLALHGGASFSYTIPGKISGWWDRKFLINQHLRVLMNSTQKSTQDQSYQFLLNTIQGKRFTTTDEEEIEIAIRMVWARSDLEPSTWLHRRESITTQERILSFLENQKVKKNRVRNREGHLRLLKQLFESGLENTFTRAAIQYFMNLPNETLIPLYATPGLHHRVIRNLILERLWRQYEAIPKDHLKNQVIPLLHSATEELQKSLFEKNLNGTELSESGVKAANEIGALLWTMTFQKSMIPNYLSWISVLNQYHETKSFLLAEYPEITSVLNATNPEELELAFFVPLFEEKTMFSFRKLPNIDKSVALRNLLGSEKLNGASIFDSYRHSFERLIASKIQGGVLHFNDETFQTSDDFLSGKSGYDFIKYTIELPHQAEITFIAYIEPNTDLLHEIDPTNLIFSFGEYIPGCVVNRIFSSSGPNGPWLQEVFVDGVSRDHIPINNKNDFNERINRSIQNMIDERDLYRLN